MCETLRDDKGRVTGFICGGHRARQRCKFCNTGYVEKLCDFATGPKKTCDAGMCAKCATSVGENRDYCPKHKHEAPSPQANLFGDDPSCPACEALARSAYSDGTTPGFFISRCAEHIEKALQS
jgi:hypothetical protein